ncbi:MAG: 50S ribosomal protein L20 [Buchnera aphidicola (Chaetogeoica yunlongensis)]
MTHIKRGVTARARHKKTLNQSKGYYGARSRTYRSAYQAVIKAGQYSYRDRRQRKRFFRKLWIARINAAVRENQISYSKFMYGLKKSFINIDRKMLSHLAISDSLTFSLLVRSAKNSLKI